MGSITDQLDRISRNTRHIKEAAAADIVKPGHFTRAVLKADLGDLIRDIDPSELGLFTFVQSRNDDEPEVARVEFHGATPLRKQPSRRDDGNKTKEIDPEIYAKAAFKFLDRYESIKPMPQAYAQVTDLLDRIQSVRKNIQNLQRALHQTHVSDGPSLRTKADAEEKRIHELQRKIAALKERKTRLQESVTVQEPAFLPITPVKPLSQGDDDWNTPAHARTLHFSESLLLDEQVDLGDVSVMSATAPSPPPKDYAVPEEQEEESSSVVDEDTIVIAKEVSISLPTPQPVRPSSESHPATPKTKLKINTEVERIVAKIWLLVGDLVKPGHGYNPSGPTNKPPLAKETIAFLQSTASLTPVPQSPTYSSTSTLQSNATPMPPAPEQILTCHLLLSLLSSPPHFSMPLSEVKALLSRKAGSDGSGPGGSLIGVLGGPLATNKILYNCVAKRLLAIDRSSGKQIVKFDI